MIAESGNNANEFAPGVTVGRGRPSGTEYIGTERALIAAGLLEPAWVTGLVGFTRQIARLDDGGFEVLGEGKGKRVRKEHKEKGAFSVSRNRDGTISVFVFRIHAEYMKERALWEAKRQAEYEEWMQKQRLQAEKESWQCAKVAHEQKDFPALWKKGVLYHVEQAERLIEGKLIFTEFPNIGIPEEDVQEAKRIITNLKKLMALVIPRIKDEVIAKGNVFSLSEFAFRNMRNS